MSPPLKRKRESSPESTGSIARSSNTLSRGGHTSRGRANSRGRGRDRGRARGRSFHIRKGASRTELLTEVWKHNTQSAYTFSPQFGPVFPSQPTIQPTVTLESPQPGVIAGTSQPLHNPANASPPHNLDDFFNSPNYQDQRSIPLRQGHRATGPQRQAHRNKRRNQASTWMDQMIPLLLEPFMDLLRRTKSGRVPVSPAANNDGACSCTSVALKITCVSWNRQCPPFPTDQTFIAFCRL